MSERPDPSEGHRSLEKTAGPRPGAPTGTFAYDEATLRSLVTKWKELADRYLASSRRISAESITPPGLDFASRAQAEASTNATKAYCEYVVKNYWYCIEQAQRMQDTLDDYLGQEHQSVILIHQSGPQAGI